MKFIHTADIHWGMIPDSDKPWGKKREQAIRLTFQGIIEDARDSRADLLLISGDLFHRQTVPVAVFALGVDSITQMLLCIEHGQRLAAGLDQDLWCITHFQCIVLGQFSGKCLIDF